MVPIFKELWRTERREEMTKVSKLILGAGALSVLGIAALPLASNAANPEEVTLSLTISATDSEDGGNNPYGYNWYVSDRDGGGTTNLSTTTGGNGATSGGLSMISTAVAASTGVTGTNAYGFRVEYTNVTGSVDSGQVYTDTSNSKIYGTDLLVGGGSTAATGVALSSTPIAVGTSAAGTVNVSIPSLAGGANGGANSDYKYDASVPTGTYTNTLSITCIPKTS
jgi:hypothetical protein